MEIGIRMSQVKILVIDDDIGMTDMLVMLLNTTSPEVLIANTGEDGIRLARENEPDIIILDLMMPEMSGWEVCQKIREFSDVPILILTSIDSSKIIAQTFDAGADDYLTKPISSMTLLAHINKLLRRSKMSFPVDLNNQNN